MGKLSIYPVADQQHVDIVTTMASDTKGFLWIGTQVGLVRYDGYRFKLFKHDPADSHSISANYIYSLWAATDGRLWVATLSDGVSVYDPKTLQFTHYKHLSDSDDSLSNNTVRTITGDNRGNIWAGTNNGLNHINSQTGKMTRIPTIEGCEAALASQQMRSLALTNPKTLWVGSASGLCRVDLTAAVKALKNIQPSALKGEAITAFSGQNIYDLLLAKDGRLWAGTVKNGAAIIHPKTRAIQRIPHIPGDQNSLRHPWVFDMAQPSEKEMWLATYGGGVAIVDANSGAIIKEIVQDPLNPFSIGSNQIGSLHVDPSGVVFIGTFGGGMNLYNPKNRAIRRLVAGKDKTQSLSHSDVQSIFVRSNGHIWVGSQNKGVDIIDPNKGVIGAHRPEPSDPRRLIDGRVRAMVETPDGDIWTGTLNGISRYVPAEKRFYSYTVEQGLPENQISSLLATPNNQLWVGTNRGLSLIDLNSKEVVAITEYTGHEQLRGVTILNMSLQDQQNVWIGTANGLYRLSSADKSIELISISSLSDNAVLGLAQDAEGRLLVGNPRGVDRLISFDNDNQPVFQPLSSLVKRPQEPSINMVLDQQGRIWDTSGLLDLKQKRWHPLSTGDGWDIGTMWWNAYTTTQEGTILFGGTKGVLMVQPQDWLDWDYNPPIVISDLEVDNQTVPVVKQLKLNAENSSFSAEIAALDYTDPKSNRYAYKLEGFDEEWIETDASRRRITYTSLPKGKYILRVKATNRKGQWSKHQVNLAITQHPAWYETLWFRLCVFSVVFTWLFLMYRWRIRQLDRKRLHLDTLVKSRTANISMLGTIGREITSNLKMETVLDLVYKHVNELMSAEAFTIGILDKDAALLRCQLSIENGKRMLPYEHSLSDNNRPGIWCIKNKKELFVNSTEELNNYVDPIPDPVSGATTESLIYMPMMIGQNIIGCISVQSFSQSAYNENDVQMLRTIANYTAIALANSESVEKLENTLEELQRTHENLHKTQKRLIQQEKMAGLGTMTAGVMHEINNPTNFTHASLYNLQEKHSELFGFLRQLAGGDDAPAEVLEMFAEKQKELENITATATEGTSRIKKIVADLSNFSRTDKDEMKSADLKLLIDSSINLIHTKFQDIEFDTQNVFTKTIPCYQAKLSQVLLNLFVNACQAIEAVQSKDSSRVGKVVLATHTDKESITLSIRDNGCGMDETTLNKVFEPFFTTKEVGSGTGLGMSISYNIIEEHGGNLELQSSINKGTTVYLSLPLHHH